MRQPALLNVRDGVARPQFCIVAGDPSATRVISPSSCRRLCLQDPPPRIPTLGNSE